MRGVSSTSWSTRFPPSGRGAWTWSSTTRTAGARRPKARSASTVRPNPCGSSTTGFCGWRSIRAPGRSHPSVTSASGAELVNSGSAFGFNAYVHDRLAPRGEFNHLSGFVADSGPDLVLLADRATPTHVAFEDAGHDALGSWLRYRTFGVGVDSIVTTLRLASGADCRRHHQPGRQVVHGRQGVGLLRVPVRGRAADHPLRGVRLGRRDGHPGRARRRRLHARCAGLGDAARGRTGGDARHAGCPAHPARRHRAAVRTVPRNAEGARRRRRSSRGSTTTSGTRTSRRGRRSTRCSGTACAGSRQRMRRRPA